MIFSQLTKKVSDGGGPGRATLKDRLAHRHSLHCIVERSRYAAERRSRLVGLGRLLYPMSHDSAQFSPSFSLAKEADIEYNPHVFWRGLRGIFSLPPRSGFVQPWRSEEHTSELQSLRHLVCR